MGCRMNLLYLVDRFLPARASLLDPVNPIRARAVQMVEPGGRSKPVVVVFYQLNGKACMMILKFTRGRWIRLVDYTSPGCGVDFADFADICGDRRKKLIIGWHLGGDWSCLEIFRLQGRNLEKLDTRPYSRMEAEDMPEADGPDGKTEFALWSSLGGEGFYRIELLRWDGEKLVEAPELNAYYYGRVIPYYEQAAMEAPESPASWYRLAEAQLKAEMPVDVLSSVDKGVAQEGADDMLEMFEQLRQKALHQLDRYSGEENRQEDEPYPETAQ